MAQPEIIKDIEARVKIPGDTMTGNLTAPTFIGSLQGNADTATKASQDSDGAVISSTYLKLSGGIMTGPITLASKGYQTNNAAGYYTNEYGNFIHSQADTKDYWHIDNNDQTISLKYYFETGNLSTQGTMTAPTVSGSLNGNASSSTYSTYTYFQDTRNVNEMPLDMLSGISLHLKANSTDGLNDGLNYHPVLMLRDWNDLSGGPFAELTITGNQNLYFRSSTTNADNTWNPWRKVLTDYNYTSILNNTYLPLTGGTMTGQIKIAAIGGSWFSLLTRPQDSGLYLDQSAATSSVYYPMMSLKFANTVFSIGGERASEVFGIFAYANSRTTNGYDAGFYVNKDFNYYCSTKLYGAVWNDYAEYRSSDLIEPGRVICETGNGTLKLSTERLQPGANVVSDTFGFAIGETENCKTPIAVSGRVLVYTYEDRYSYEAGDPVCAAPGGTVSKMSREEVMMYPDRIVGTVSEIPEYECWGTGNVEVKNRIWIKIK